MTEEELRRALEGGEVQQTQKKPANRPIRADKPAANPVAEENQETNATRTAADKSNESKIAQPASTRVGDEDIECSSTSSRRSFWDRPDPPPQYEWMYDPRMPGEWNQVIGSMRAWEGRNVRPVVAMCREALPDEVSEPMNFERKTFKKQKRPIYRLSVADESEFNLIKLRERFDRPHKEDGTASLRAAHDLDKTKSANSGRLTPEDYPRLRQQWYDEFEDMVCGTKPQLPPWREVNHEIHLIDDTKQYTYHAPRCPMSLRDEFYAKVNRYVEAKWWEPRSVKQAAPLLCIPKKDGSLRTPLDARQRNDNTIKDVTPLPDQEVIREDVARAKVRSKIDLTDAYEQVRIRNEDVGKTAFATIAGTYVSNIMQIGDCNAPATFQRLMTSIFRDVIGKFMHVYLDDIFIYSESIEEHESHLRIVFERLREQSLYLKWKKCELYADKVDCLGHIIDDQGIHPDADKLARIRDWRTPRNYNDVQRFVGLVNYVGSFLPDVSAYTGPLMAMTQNGTPFYWRPIHQRCFDMIKHICCSTPIIRPIQPKTGCDDGMWILI
ncbi:putative DNA RNA polymerase [Lyophyllum shimeji]|uniref:DNA RNA polymerase n=1 Tax=Lyophyllum shimeji TaxID=47721 RepID=A0A9P3PW37_LYOSH|nr:putative DNA RNA polymerase [Lyophyllum shimeji]